MPSAPPPRVLVFGATSAMAQATARLLAARGAALFLVGRDPEKLGAVAADLRVRGATVHVAAADLDDRGRHAGLLAQAFATLGAVDLVLVAQGVLATSDEAEADLGVAERLLVTNFLAPALLCEAAALRLAEQGSGTVIAIGSVAGDRGRQSNYAYGAAKGGLAIFLEGLRNRMFRRGVHVVTVKPGFVDSPMTAHLAKNALFAPPSAVAREILRAVERRRDVVYVPWFWRPIMLVIRHLPERLFKRLAL
jgi:decaprenylphospho-beta-D-erythro-pentofuranosid-2-ulose 2-reductase